MRSLYYLGLLVLLTNVFSSCKTPKGITAPVVINLDGTNFENDFQTQQAAHLKIKNGSIVQVNITNLNKDLYTVKITPSLVSYNTTVPSALSIASAALPSPIFPTIGMGATKAKNCIPDVNTEQGNINQNMPYLKQSIESINKVLAFNNYLLLMQKECGLTAAKIRSDVDREMNSISGGADWSAFFTYFNSNIAAAKRYYTRIAESAIKIERLYGKADCVVPLDKSVGMTESEKAQLADFKTFYAKILDLEQTKQLEVIHQNYLAITEAGNYTFTAVDTVKHADEVRFAMSITPKNWMPCKPVNGTYNLKIKVDRFKVDFSTGIFVNFGSEKFSGKKFFIDSNQKIAAIPNVKKAIIPSLGALVHLYYNYNYKVIPGIVLGTSVASDAKYANFHGGLSFMFNADNEILNRIALSGGLTYRYVNVMNPGYPEGTALDKNLTIDQLQNGKFVPGGFFAITYNFTKK